jgi:hypothetical protein
MAKKRTEELKKKKGWNKGMQMMEDDLESLDFGVQQDMKMLMADDTNTHSKGGFDTGSSFMTKEYSSSWDDGYSVKKYKACWEDHQPLKIGKYKIYGGSCIAPLIKNADVYIGLDRGMERMIVEYPWNPSNKKKEVVEVYFPITDMQVPTGKNLEEFKKMIVWTAEQLVLGKKVHVGCIGGHGRTGTFLAALVKHMLGIEDAITYVRENYCKKAVESESQIQFLHKEFGIKTVAATKVSGFGMGGYVDGMGGKGSAVVSELSTSFAYSKGRSPIPPVQNCKCIWG